MKKISGQPLRIVGTVKVSQQKQEKKTSPSVSPNSQVEAQSVVPTQSEEIVKDIVVSAGAATLLGAEELKISEGGEQSHSTSSTPERVSSLHQSTPDKIEPVD